MSGFIDLIVVDQMTREERYDICKECPHFKPKLKRCEVCGCFMKLKTKLMFARCPEGKW